MTRERSSVASLKRRKRACSHSRWPAARWAARELLETELGELPDGPRFTAPDADTLCNMVKLFASEEILKVAQHCLELHGGNGVMLDFGVEKIFRDAAIFLHMDATVDISKLKIVKSMFPETAGKYAGPE